MTIESRPRDNGESGRIERDLRAAYGAYAYLRGHDLARVSTTSRMLREADLARLARRVRDELDELRGVIDGTHGHGHGRDDVVLEAYQSLHWLTVLAVAAGDTYDDVLPHTALEHGQPSPPTPLPHAGEGSSTQPSPPTYADRSLGSAEPTAQPALPHTGRGEQSVADATGLEDLDSADPMRRRQAIRQGAAHMADLCGRAGVAVAEPIARDLSELRARSYLAPYWEAMDA